MSNNIILMDNRQLIPRWHTSRKAMSYQFPTLISPCSTGRTEQDRFVSKAIENWSEERNVVNATELYSALMIRGLHSDPNANDALRFLLQNEKDLPRGVGDLIYPRLKHIDKSTKYYSSTPGEVHRIISRLKKIVGRFPRDFMTWCDLGFYYTVIGNLDKAERSLSIAWANCQGNAYVARSYARFLIHNDSPEKAMWVLRKTGAVGVDPLITSASIAIGNAFDIQGVSISKAKRLLADYRGLNAFSSELAAALGTIEVLNGSKKKARELFQLAMREPSENAVSQYKWLRHKYDFDLNGELAHISGSVEGNVNELYVQGRFTECRDKLLELFSFQPISDAPISDAGYMSLAGLNDFDFVINLSENRIPITHMSFGELNNLIVAKLLKGQLVDIDVYLKVLARKIEDKSSNTYGTYMATSGMALFKLNEIPKAKEQYHSAIRFFERKKSFRSVALAEHFYSKCVENHDPDIYLELRTKVEKKAKDLKMPELSIASVKEGGSGIL